MKSSIENVMGMRSFFATISLSSGDEKSYVSSSVIINGNIPDTINPFQSNYR